MAKETTLTSVGIDIGTTTTQVVISQLTLVNVMPGSRIPRIEVAHKTITYLGKIHFTPFLDREKVDGQAIKNLIAEEYARAGVSPSQIDTGAVIITGETAKKENASTIIHSLAEYAGDFVVATAGPDLESVIAGRGSGAQELSKRLHLRLVNIDIGGGTTNIACFDKGKCIGTACLNVGGRLFEVNPLTHVVTYVAPSAKSVLKALNTELDNKDIPVQQRVIKQCLDVMVSAVAKVINNQPLKDIEDQLTMTNSLPPVTVDGLVFSGGVAKYIYEPGLREWWIHGDVGPLLAEAFLSNSFFAESKVHQGSETIHSTVIGAGAHTLNISGSTVTISKDTLPLRNIPAIYPEKNERGYSWIKSTKKFDMSIYKTAALIIPPLHDTDFKTILSLAQNLAQELQQINGFPKVVIAQQDIAKVVGQTLLNIMGPIPLVCLDGIELYLGDFLDIAKPLPHDDAVPVIVKTLVFVR